MKVLMLTKFNRQVFLQFQLKTLRTRPFYDFLAINFKFFYFHIETFKNALMVESFFFLRYISNSKSYLSYIKKKYKEFDFIISLRLNKNQSYYFIFLWIIFFSPAYHKRNIRIKLNQNTGGDFSFSNNSYDIFPFFSNLYFSWFKKLNYLFIFPTGDFRDHFLFTTYYDFPLFFRK